MEGEEEGVVDEGEGVEDEGEGVVRVSMREKVW